MEATGSRYRSSGGGSGEPQNDNLQFSPGSGKEVHMHAPQTAFSQNPSLAYVNKWRSVSGGWCASRIFANWPARTDLVDKKWKAEIELMSTGRMESEGLFTNRNEGLDFSIS